MMIFENLFILVLVLLFLGFSSFFSASETAITAASKARLHQLAKLGNSRAITIKDLQKNLGIVISTMLMGNTLFNSAAVSLLTEEIVRVFGNSGLIQASAIIITGILIIIYAEVMPKIFAIQSPELFLLRFAFILKFIFSSLKPLTLALNFIARIHLKIFGIRTYNSDSNGYVTIEELHGMIDLHYSQDNVSQSTPYERVMLKSILDLNSIQLNKIMIHRKNIAMININKPVNEIIDFVLSSSFNRIPLWKDNQDNIIGIIYSKDLLRVIRNNNNKNKTLNHSDILKILTKPWFVPESTDLLDQLLEFRKRREHFAIIVDEYGSLLGIVTLKDVLEEIVGDISDNHDSFLKDGVHSQKDGSYIVHGSANIRDINRKLNWNLSNNQASTIAGLILYRSKLIPEVGQVFLLDGFRFEVIKRHKNQIILLRVYPPEQVNLSITSE